MKLSFGIKENFVAIDLRMAALKQVELMSLILHEAKTSHFETKYC